MIALSYAKQKKRFLIVNYNLDRHALAKCLLKLDRCITLPFKYLFILIPLPLNEIVWSLNYFQAYLKAVVSIICIKSSSSCPCHLGTQGWLLLFSQNFGTYISLLHCHLIAATWSENVWVPNLCTEMKRFKRMLMNKYIAGVYARRIEVLFPIPS